jgi:hypothetical protein
MHWIVCIKLPFLKYHADKLIGTDIKQNVNDFDMRDTQAALGLWGSVDTVELPNLVNPNLSPRCLTS